MSAYFMTINPNISHKDLKNDDYLEKVVKKYDDILILIKLGLENGILLINNTKSNLIKYEYKFEMGKIRHFLHCHLLCVFDNNVLLDYSSIRTIINDIRDDNFKVHLNIKRVKYNPLDAITKYINKNPL